MNRFSKAYIKWAFFILLTVFLSPQSRAKTGETYRLNPGDKMQISVWGEENLHSDVVVSPDGSINFPLAGQISADRKTTDELTSALKKRLEKYIPNPEINIRLLAADGNAIYVVGEIAHPGTIEMKRPINVMQALSIVGGLTPFASKSSIRILRQLPDGRSMSIPFDYSEVEEGENIDSNIVLQSGDTIVVP